jgi:chromosome segregation ATPase
MKKALIILAVLAAGLVFALLRARQSAGAIAQQAQTQLGASSNRIAELEMKLNHQEQLARALGSQVTNRIEELNQRTAEISRLRAALTKSESETREVRASLAATVPVRQQLETDVAGLKARIGELGTSLAESAKQGRDQAGELAALNSQRNALAQQLAHLRQELATSEARLQNPQYLESQLDALDDVSVGPAEAKRVEPVISPRMQASASPKPLRAARVSMLLELQPDGSVRTAPAN